MQIKTCFNKKPGGFILVLVLGLLITSCEDFLEDVDPSAALPIEEGFDSLEDLELFLNGTYQALIGLQGNQFFVTLPDLMTSDVTTRSGACTDQEQYDLNQLTAANRWLPFMWFVGYRTINQANVLMEKTTVLESDGTITSDDADRLKGEALFLRGIAYFQLVRMFAQPFDQGNNGDLAVPMPLEGVVAGSDLNNLPRETVAEIYQRITQDFELAYDLLGESVAPNVCVDSCAALAGLAEVAFQQGDYSTALNLTRQIIESNKFALVGSPDDYFTQKGTSEEIWSLTHTSQDPGGLNHLTQGNSCNSLALDRGLYDNAFEKVVTVGQREEISQNGWAVVDLRFTRLTNGNLDNWRSLKYPNIDGSNNVPVIRYAQILLAHAECLARMNDISGAVEYLNMIRARSLEVYGENGNLLSDDVVLFTAGDFESADQLIEAIILERRVELAMEGKRFHDLMRLKRDVNGIPFDNCRLRWPIPQAELDANPNISQDYPIEC